MIKSGAAKTRWRFVWILSFFVIPASLYAQGGATGAISGTVEDSSGGVVSGAKVEVVSTATNELLRSENSNSSGFFSVTLLPAGTYVVRVTAPGLAETSLRDVAVRVTETTPLTITLNPASVQQTVEVTATVPVIKTTDATTGESLGGQTIRDLPLATQNFQQLLALSAGAASSLNSASQLGRGDVRINVNGGREDNNNYQIDGIGANDPNNEGELAYTPLPSPDAIQEFKVSTSLYDATQGRNGGGNINAVLKSGSSTFHFDAFEYFRNTDLDANDFFVKRHELEFGEAQTRPVIQQNIFGGSGGGPIGEKARLGFFFVNYQGTRQRSGDSPGTIISTTIPLLPVNRSSANLQSIFFPSGLPPFATNGMDSVALQLLQLTNPQFKTLENPQGFLFPSGSAAPGTVCSAGDPNCTQPGLNPVTGAVHNGSFLISTPGRFTDNQFTANWDREFNGSRDHLSVRSFYSDVEADQPFGGDSFTLQTGGVPLESNLNFPMNTFVHDRFGSVAETHIFTNNLVNEFRLGISIIGWKFKTVQPVTADDLGIVRPTNNITDDVYRIQFNSSGFQFGAYPTQPFTNLSDSFSYEDTLSYVKGAHSFRFGGEIDRTDIRKNIPVADNGFLFFGPGGGLSDFQNFLIGDLAGSLTNSGLSNHDYKVPSFSLFAQDDYRVTKTLTLNLGFREEFLGAAYDRFCRTANIDPALTSTTGQPFVYPTCVSQFDLPGITGTLKRDNMNNNYASVWEPRLGFAYDLLGHHTTSIRGGYGIYSIREDAGALDNLALEPPFVPGAAPVGVQNGGLATFLSTGGPGGTPLIPPGGVLDKVDFTPQSSSFMGFSSTGCNANGTPTNPTGDSTLNPCFSGTIPFFFSPIVPLHFIAPTMQQWNLSVQRSFGKNWGLEVGYIGTKGSHLRSAYNNDQAKIASPTAPIIIKGISCDGTLTGAGQQCAITQNTFSNLQARAPFLGIGTFNDEFFGSDSDSHYNGLQTTVTHRFSKDFYLQSAYTFSKSIDDTSSSQVAFLSRFNDQTIARDTRGLSDFDRTQRWITIFTYTLQLFSKSEGFVHAALSDWNVSGVFTLQSGLPFSVFDSAGGGAYGNAPPSLATPTFASGFSCGNSLTKGSTISRLNDFINPAAFLNDAPVPNSPDGSTGFGDVPRNCFRGPHQVNLDFSIAKVFQFGERQRLKFSTDFFNLSNTASFANPAVTDINSGAFGTITQVVGTPRLIQFVLRYSY